MVTKILARKTSGRHIIPVFLINEENQIERVGNETARKDKFQNTGSVILHQESSKVNSYFKKFELFFAQIEETNNFEEVNPVSCKYQTLNGNASSIHKLPMVVESIALYAGETIKLPYSGIEHVFLFDNDFVYGPYALEQSEYEPDDDDDEKERDEEEDNTSSTGSYAYKIVDLDIYTLGLDNSYQKVILKFDRQRFESFIIRNRVHYTATEYKHDQYVLDVKEVIDKLSPEGFILDENEADILYWSENAFPKNYTEEELKKYFSSNDSSNPFDKERLVRFLSIKDKSSKWLEFLNSYISNHYLLSEEGLSRFNKYIEANRSVLLKEVEEQLRKEAQQKLKSIDEERTELDKKLMELKTEIKLKEDEKIRLGNESEMILERSEKLREIDAEINTKSVHLKLLGDIEQLRGEEKTLQDVNYRNRSFIEDQEKRLMDLRKKNREELNRTINELYPFVQAIVAAPVMNPASEERKDVTLPVFTLKDTFSINAYISGAKSFLQSFGRQIEEVDIINILTCINQGFVTIFTGLPGVGKTSLARILSQYICSPYFSIEIPVGRGWNTKKNLLGYYNPLNNEYQADEYGIIEKLEVCNSQEELMKKTSFIVTLDEANLSPVEHYWSDFIVLSDKECKRTIPLSGSSGQRKLLDLPDGFSFIFTINHDHTTELLSPRLIDRSCFIKIPHNHSFSPATVAKELPVAPDYYSFEATSTFFTPKEPGLTSAEKRLLDDLLKILMDKTIKFGRQVIVSQRKLYAIYLYCTVTRDLYKDRGHGQFFALDYAVLQFIIPLISGYGVHFESRLVKFKEELQTKSLPKSAQEVEDIINRGKDFQNFSFFS